MSQRKHKPKTQISSRLPRIDALRGLAVIAMVAYHLCYDLVYFQWAQFDFQYDSFWQTARFLIVSSFLLLVGIGLQLATAGESYLKSRHWNRLLKIAACALLVSVGSFLLFGQRFIFFGILHLIVVASLIALWLRHIAPRWRFLLATLCCLLGFFFEHALFDKPALQWLGMMTHEPATEDYAPLLPWLGMVLYGSLLGTFLLKSRVWQARLSQSSPHMLDRGLQFFGRRALWVYMLHQPLLFAFLSLLKSL